MGPTCDIHFAADVESVLPIIDTTLAFAAEQIERTRKGLHWDVRVNRRPIHVSVDSDAREIVLSAGCNDEVDYAVIRQLSDALARAVGGFASEPTK